VKTRKFRKKQKKNFYTQSSLSISKELDVDLPVIIFIKFIDENDNYFHYEVEHFKTETVY
jgi:hypothetical protein